MDGCFLRLNRGFRDPLGLGALVEGLLGDRLIAHQLLAAGEVRFREREIRLRLRQIGVRLVERSLERPLVDGEEQISLLDHLAVFERDLFEVA